MKNINLKQARFLALSLLTVFAFNNFSLTQAAPQATSSETASVIAGMNDVTQRETKALELLRQFLTCPVTQVPLWRNFVDQLTTLLAGIDEYKGLCDALLKVRNITNPAWGKKQIADAISPHIANIKKIPTDIVNTFNKMGYIERISRVKLK